MRKLQLHNAAAITMYAIRNGLAVATGAGGRRGAIAGVGVEVRRKASRSHSRLAVAGRLQEHERFAFIQYPNRASTGWTGPCPTVTIRAMAREIRIDKLSDEFGQYTLVLKCSECGHERTTEPHTLGRLCGWDARLEDLAKRMRCSKCGKKKCSLRAFPPTKPRGYSALGEIAAPIASR